MKRSELIQSVINWNRKFPLDRWWRQKHNVPFMSPAHRESSFIHQLMEYEEEKMFLETFVEEKGKELYVPGAHDIFKAPSTMKGFMDEAEREIQEMLEQENDGRGQENQN